MSCNEQTTEVSTEPSTPMNPLLPALYFRETVQDSSALTEKLPAEILTNITSYLDWGDYARLAPVHSSFKSIVTDAANFGGHDSQWTLAEALLNGTNGLEQNPALAIDLLQKLTGVTVPDYEDDDNCNKNTSPPIQEEETVSKQIDDETDSSPSSPATKPFTPAMRKLATCHLTGSGVSKNTSLGLAWLQAASQHSDIDAAHEIATIYEYGVHGVAVDVILAANWFLHAAKGGHVESMCEYAMCCELGCGVEQSDEKALEWYTRAAELGHVTANFSVGEMFEEARGGLPQSDSEAVLWYYKAALMGDADSKKALHRLRDIARIVLPGWASTLNE